MNILLLHLPIINHKFHFNMFFRLPIDLNSSEVNNHAIKSFNCRNIQQCRRKVGIVPCWNQVSWFFAKLLNAREFSEWRNIAYYIAT